MSGAFPLNMPEGIERTMAVASDITERLEALFRSQLQVDVPGPDIDLFDTGILDSLKFVELLAALEETFGIQIAVEELELDDFRTVARIVRFLAGKAATLRG